MNMYNRNGRWHTRWMLRSWMRMTDIDWWSLVLAVLALLLGACVFQGVAHAEGLGYLSGEVFMDANLNSVRDDGEALVPHAVVYLDAVAPAGAASGMLAYANYDGYFTFPALPVGEYRLYAETDDGAHMPGAITVTIGEVNAAMMVALAVAHAQYLPMVARPMTVQSVDMPSGATATEQRHVYMPTTPNYARFGTVFGTAFCRSTNKPAPGVTVYFVYAAGNDGTWGVANGVGQFVIVAVVGTVGYLEWNGAALTDAFTITDAPRYIIVYLDC